MWEHTWIQSGDKRLSAMVHKVKPEQSPVVIMCHGFTGNKVGANHLFINLAKKIELANYHVVRFDFTGSGESEGEFEADTRILRWKQDLKAVIDYVKHSFSASPIYLLGHSLGGYVVLLTEDTDDIISGKIAIAPVVEPVENFRKTILGPELYDLSLNGNPISNFYGKGLTLNSQFVSELERLPNFVKEGYESRRPILFVHGSNDVAVPIEGTDQLFESYQAEKEMVIIEGSDHVFTGKLNELQEAITKWLHTQK